MHRLYNPYTGEHLYTSSDNEKSDLVKVGWNDEGTGWIAPSSGDPVYRLYNIYAVGGDHHYTKSKDEYDYLKTVGWTQEGVVWYSASESEGVPVYRQYNPYATTGTHNYTISKSENDQLVSEGWKEEGEAWYGVNSSNSGTKKYTVTFDSNGGSAVDKQTVESGTAASKPANPTKTGYTFVAWFEDESLTMPYYFASKVSENLTLYAKWQSSTLPTPNPPDSCVTVYRLVNQTTGCYLFTAVKTDVTEKTANGWVNEGVAWYAPKESKRPVYSLYKPSTGYYHFTTSTTEREYYLASNGWTDEGVAFYSDVKFSVPVYRLYNKDVEGGDHFYTADRSEHDKYVAAGWIDEAFGWYASAAASS